MTNPQPDPVRNLPRNKKPFMRRIFEATNVLAGETGFAPDDLDSLFDDVTVPVRGGAEQNLRQAELPMGEVEGEVEEKPVLEQMLAALPPDGPAMNGHRGADPLAAQSIEELFAALLTANDNDAIMRCLKVDSRIGVETLYSLLNTSLHRKLIALTGPDRVEDAIQDAFRKFIATLFQSNGWKANGSVEGWLLRVAQNFYKETQRDRTTPFTDFSRTEEGEDGDQVNLFDERVGADSSDLLTMQGRPTDLESLLSLDELIDLKQALSKLLPTFDNDQRLVLSLILEGYDIADIANVTRLTTYRVGLIWREITGMLREAIQGNPILPRAASTKNEPQPGDGDEEDGDNEFDDEEDE